MIIPVTTENLPELIAMAREMHAHSQFSGLPFSERMLSIFALNPAIYARMYRNSNGEFGGAMVGGVGGDVFTELPHAWDAGLYVKPEHRKGRAAVELLRDFEAWAKAHGAVEVRPGVTAGIDNGAAVAFYRAMGYSEVGPLFRKGI